jgi:calcineurin-like phosphoesterase family protein
MIFFISDHHFFHSRIIKLVKRPFKTVDIMNATMVSRHNEIISPKDHVIFGGDFSFGSKEVQKELLNSLNGIKILVLGNHDGNAKRMREVGFKNVLKVYEDDYIVLRHNPHHFTETEINSGKLLLHGHKHENLVEAEKGNFINICVEQQNYYPMTLQQLILKWRK